MKKILIGLLILILVSCGGAYFWYTSQFQPVSTDETVVLFEIPSGSTVNATAQRLENENLIKSALAFRIFVRLDDLSNLQAGYYEISPAMDMRTVAEKIFSGDAVFPDTITITFPEGKTLDEMAEILANQTIYTKEEILAVWDGEEFINQAVVDYWFVTEDVYNTDLKYSLNGYLFPDTYRFANDAVTPQEAGNTLLSEMDDVLTQRKDQIENSEWSVHQILTMASIVEYEARLDEDRPIIAGVFYNRLEANMPLQSCATLQMALGVHKQIYNSQDMAVNSPYNTYLISGLPVGPGNNPGEPSIDAALNPASHNYYYFLSDIYNDSKTYYSETYEEHRKLQNELLK